MLTNSIFLNYYMRSDALNNSVSYLLSSHTLNILHIWGNIVSREPETLDMQDI